MLDHTHFIRGMLGPHPFSADIVQTTPTLYPRHHTNPVGTEWRWKMDDPQTILQGALENHYQMVKQFKGELLNRGAPNLFLTGL